MATASSWASKTLAGELAEGDWKQRVLEHGPGSYPAPPSSGNTWSRAFLEAVMPMPEPVYFVAADGYLRALAPLWGPVASVQEPVVSYRVHGGNTSHAGWKKDPQWRLARDTRVYEQMCEDLAQFATKLGCPKRAEDWTSQKWIHLLRKHIAHRGNALDTPDSRLSVTLRAAAWRILASHGKFLRFTWSSLWPGSLRSRCPATSCSGSSANKKSATATGMKGSPVNERTAGFRRHSCLQPCRDPAAERGLGAGANHERSSSSSSSMTARRI
ncbi:MAG: hypothetical protein QM796_15115 [Chthoniobacteraceae bacterium]